MISGKLNRLEENQYHYYYFHSSFPLYTHIDYYLNYKHSHFLYSMLNTSTIGYKFCTITRIICTPKGQDLYQGNNYYLCKCTFHQKIESFFQYGSSNSQCQKTLNRQHSYHDTINKPLETKNSLCINYLYCKHKNFLHIE